MGTPKGTKPWNAGKGKGWINPRGYRIICRTINGKRFQIREHRDIMERKLGRSLEPWEVVHHKDGDPSNNKIKNLAILSFGEHTVHHHTGTKKSYETRRTIEAMANMREEIKRLRAINAELLVALQSLANIVQDEYGFEDYEPPSSEGRRGEYAAARAAIAKALGNE